MTYNGHKNYQTWNVLLWINNDEGFYSLAKSCTSYDDFISCLKDDGMTIDTKTMYQTPDGVSWDDPTIDRESINADWIQDFAEDAA